MDQRRRRKIAMLNNRKIKHVHRLSSRRRVNNTVAVIINKNEDDAEWELFCDNLINCCWLLISTVFVSCTIAFVTGLLPTDYIGWHSDKTAMHLANCINYYHQADKLQSHFVEVADKISEEWQQLELHFEIVENAIQKHIEGLKSYVKISESNGEDYKYDNEGYLKMLKEEQYPDLIQLKDQLKEKELELLDGLELVEKSDKEIMDEHDKNRIELLESFSVLLSHRIIVQEKDKGVLNSQNFDIRSMQHVVQLLLEYYIAESTYKSAETNWFFYYFPSLELLINSQLSNFYEDDYFKRLRFKRLPKLIKYHQKSLASFMPWVDFAERKIEHWRNTVIGYKLAVQSQLPMWTERVSKKSQELIYATDKIWNRALIVREL